MYYTFLSGPSCPTDHRKHGLRDEKDHNMGAQGVVCNGEESEEEGLPENLCMFAARRFMTATTQLSV